MNNPVNKLINKVQVENMLNFFGPIGGTKESPERLLVNNLEFYQEAFIHESYHQAVQNYLQHPDPEMPIYLNYVSNQSNEIKEYLGDHVLKTCLGKYLYLRFGSQREGFMTRLKIKLEQCSTLHQIAVSLGFKQFLLLSLQIENMTILGMDRGRRTPSFYEDAFEAFLGSIMEDFGEQGYIYADRFVINIIENLIDFGELVSQNSNFKDSIQRYFQKATWRVPTYITIEENGPLYRKTFTRMLYITESQLNELTRTQISQIKEYTQQTLNHYKLLNPKVFIELFNQITDQNKWILCIGTARKIVSAEQEAAKQALVILGLPQDY